MQPSQIMVKRPCKVYCGCLLILAAVVYLIYSSTKVNAQFFMTIDELHARVPAWWGAVCGSQAQCWQHIQFNPIRKI